MSLACHVSCAVYHLRITCPVSDHRFCLSLLCHLSDNDPDKLSKKKKKMLSRLKIAELKQVLVWAQVLRLFFHYDVRCIM
jgi:hypothetical protein